MSLFATESAEASRWLEWAGGTAAMAGVGVLLFLLLAPKLIDWVTPGDLKAELLGKNGRPPNLALAVVVAAMFLGVALIVAAAVK